MQRRSLLQAVGASAAVLAAPTIQAQNLPAGPIRIVVGFPPGGGTDALARVLAQKLQAMWGVSIVIDNKAGAAGVIALNRVSINASITTIAASSRGLSLVAFNDHAHFLADRELLTNR